MDVRIKFDVNGHLFKTPFYLIENGPQTKLTKLFKDGLCMNKADKIIINRPIESFSAILAFYQTGKLHIPMTSCPEAFMNELEYWEISPEMLSDCCYNRLQGFLDEQQTLRRFKESREQDISSTSSRCGDDLRTRVWEIIDYTRPTIVGKIYFITTLFMVLMSICILAYSSYPSSKRDMTDSERLEYEAWADTNACELMNNSIKQACNESKMPANSSLSTGPDACINETVPFNQNGNVSRKEIPKDLRKKLNNLFEYLGLMKEEINVIEEYFEQTEIKENVNNNTETSDDLDSSYDILDDVGNTTQFNESDFNNSDSVNNTNINNQLELVNGTNFKEIHSSQQRFNLTRGTPLLPFVNLVDEVKRSNITSLKTKVFILIIMECVTSVYFSVDIILRLFSCPSLKKFFMSIINVSDVVSLLGGYLYLCLYYMFPCLRYGSWIDVLSYMPMIRILRLFRLISNIRAGKVLAHSFKRNIKDVSVMFLFLMTGTFTFGTLFYLTENESTVESIPGAWYWALITMTTVGYGEIHPMTMAGRIVACSCAVSGILLHALIVPIFASNFFLLYQHVESESIIPKMECKRKSDKYMTLNYNSI